MKKTSRSLVLILLLLPVFLLVTAPAELAGWIMQKSSGSTVMLDRPEGSLWSGRAKGLVIAGHGSGAVLPDFSWRMRWSGLLGGEAVLDLAYGDGQRSGGTLARGWHGLRLENVDAAVPGVLLPSLIPEWGNVLSGGEIRVRSDNFSIHADGSGSGASELVWSNAASPFSEVSPLGDFRVRLAHDREAVTFTLDTLEGPLRLDGNGTWSARNGLAFDGSARGDPGRRAELEPVLELLGPETTEGARRLSIRMPGQPAG